MMKLLCAPLVLLGLLLASTPLSAASREQYRIDYTVRFLPAQKLAEVTLRHTPGSGRLIQARFAMPKSRYPLVKGVGELKRRGDEILWTPPAKKSATLTWRYLVDHRRSDGGYDARITAEWAILRGDDLVPPARIRATKGSDAFVRMKFEMPAGWTNADTPYLLARDGKAFIIDNPERNFARPVGWLIAGAVGTRREFVQDMEVSVAGPKGGDVRRNDMLAFFNGLVPEFRRAFGVLPPKLLIVSAGDPMWRGGLSGPRSLFVHADRPMISENGTSTLVHELTHVITRIRGAEDDDWITEGLAEYYSIELLHRAGLLSESRYLKAFEWMARHGRKIKHLNTDRSSGERTARAVTFFRELDAELRLASGGRYNLDHITRALVTIRRVSREDLQKEVEQRVGKLPLFDSPLLQ